MGIRNAASLILAAVIATGTPGSRHGPDNVYFAAGNRPTWAPCDSFQSNRSIAANGRDLLSLLISLFLLLPRLVV